MTTPTLTSKTLGYYNPNPFPLVLSVSELNTSISLGPNQFILDGAGNKINDPVFDNYCRPMCLAEEKTKVEVPVRMVARPEQVVNPSTHAFTAATEFVTGARGEIVSSTPTTASAPQPAANSQPIQEFTIEQAIKMGLIRAPGRMVEDDPKAPKDVEVGLSAEEINARPLATPGLNAPVKTADAPEIPTSITEIAKSVAKKSNVELPVAPQPILTTIASNQVSTEPVVTAPAEVKVTKVKKAPKAPKALPIVEATPVVEIVAAPIELPEPTL